jgi:uncharacterized protein (DUF488 family)
MRIYTIGHSTRSLEEFVTLLREHDVERLADIRRFPGSRRYPHFSREALERSLPEVNLSRRAATGSRVTPRPHEPTKRGGTADPVAARRDKLSGIAYVHIPELGGRRKPAADSPNLALRNEQFRAYADHMASDEFRHAVDGLLAFDGRTAVMCAEAVPWRCHRNLLADELLRRGCEVVHIIGPGQTRRHEMSGMARIEGDHVVYPAEQSALPL